MQYYQFTNANSKIPLRSKVSFILGTLLVLSLLFFFAFTIFLIFLAAGAVLFVINLFQKAQGKIVPEQKRDIPQPRPFNRPSARDDDIIDI